MKKPKYTSEILSIIFLVLGSVFILFGCLSFAKIIKPTAHSYVQDSTLMGQIFCLLGGLFCIMQVIFKVFNYNQIKLENELISTGIKIVGKVERVRSQKQITFGRKSPYVVYYTYLYKDKIHHKKSYLLWDKPDLSNGDKINVFINNKWQSTLQL